MSERLARAALRKAEESSQAKLEFFSSQAPRIADCAEHMNRAFERGYLPSATAVAAATPSIWRSS